MTSLGHYIDGRWVSPGGSDLASINPATGERIWQGASATDAQVDQAVAAARGAFEHWSGNPLDQRVEAVRRFAVLLDGKRDLLTRVISNETGKPHWESQTEVAAVISKVDLSVEAYGRRCPIISADLNGFAATTRYKPHGVCAVYGPFNFPGHVPNGHIVPALIAGNTVVFKPSELTPLTGQEMVRIWEESGLPPGVVNLVQGGPQSGKALSAHADLDGLFFTGSSRVGRVLTRQAADHPRRILALELGGNNPLVVWDAHDLGAAAYQIIQSAYITSGQRCTCARRLIIPNGTPGKMLLEALLRQIEAVQVGLPFDDPQPFMGPMISDKAASEVLLAQESMRQGGGQVLFEMTQVGDRTAMVRPGLIDVTHVADRTDEEYFGPLLQVIRVDSFDAAIREANRTDYGLAAGLLSDRSERFELFYARVRAGVICWNRPTTGASGRLPFGGVGSSGNHRPSGYFACDYCSYPTATLATTTLAPPDKPVPGVAQPTTTAAQGASKPPSGRSAEPRPKQV